MSNPRFQQAERRSLLVPALIALVFLAAALVVARHFFPATSIDVVPVETQLLPTHTVFSNDTKVIGAAQSQDVLFVVSTVKVHNGMREPIYLDGASCTLTDSSGATLTVKAVERTDLGNVEASFPKLSPLMQHPLTRDAAIEPGKELQGTVLFSFPFTAKQWKARKSATLELDLYHQPPSYVTLPAETSTP